MKKQIAYAVKLYTKVPICASTTKALEGQAIELEQKMSHLKEKNLKLQEKETQSETQAKGTSNATLKCYTHRTST